MAEHSGSEVIAAALASVLAFFGAFGAAIKFWKTPDVETGNSGVIAQQIKDLDRRQTAMDERIDEVFHLLGGVKDSLAQAQADIREALTRLQERRK